MNPYFSWTRFQNMMLHTLRINTRNYLLCAGVIALLSFIESFNLSGSHTEFIYTVAMSVCLPFTLFKWMFHKTQGVAWLMIPASSLEKYTSYWLANVVFLPLLCLVSILCGNAIGIAVQEWFLGDFFHKPWLMGLDSFENLSDILITTWLLQAPTLFCIMHFKEKKARKAIGYTALIFFVILVLTMTLGMLLSFSYSPTLSLGLRDFLRELFYFAGDYLYFFFNLAWVLGFWALSFVRMRRQQI